MEQTAGARSWCREFPGEAPQEEVGVVPFSAFGGDSKGDKPN